jgi:cytochrome c oxidase subunit 2
VFAAISLFILGLLVRVALTRKTRACPTPNEAAGPTLRDRVWTFAPLCVFALVAAILMRSVYLQNAAPAADLTITVTGHMWYWTYQYGNGGNFSFRAPMLANAATGANATGAYDHMMVPVNRTVRIVAVATNVIYSWAIPEIGAEMEAAPGWTRQSSFLAANEGRYYGKCSELCGLPHTFRPVEIEVVSQRRFDKWVAGAREKLAQAHS